MNVLNEELLKAAKSSENSLKQYFVTNFRHMPVIVDNYLQNNDFIRDMDIKLASDEEVQYPLTIYIHADSDDLESINPDWEEFFDCRFVLDMDWYLNKYNKNAKRRRDFAPKQNIIYQFLRKSARGRVFVTSRVELKRFLTESAIDKNLSIFRSQYREIFNKPMDFDILAYDRTNECYKIHKDILTDKPN